MKGMVNIAVCCDYKGLVLMFGRMIMFDMKMNIIFKDMRIKRCSQTKCPTMLPLI